MIYSKTSAAASLNQPYQALNVNQGLYSMGCYHVLYGFISSYESSYSIAKGTETRRTMKIIA